MRRGDIHWAAMAHPIGRRPVLLVSRTSALAFLNRVTVAPITSTVRGIPSELPVGTQNGLRRASVAGCDSLMTIEKADIEPRRIGQLTREQLGSLDHTLAFALGISN